MKHTKSLNGCWTCRTRKIKCDEQRPACLQCRKRAYVCEGYDIRLRWLEPESGPVCNNELQDSTRENIQRRQLPFEHPVSVLTSDEIDFILKSVDTPCDTDLASNAAADESRHIHCFGAFRASTAAERDADARAYSDATTPGVNSLQSEAGSYPDDTLDIAESMSIDLMSTDGGGAGHAASNWQWHGSTQTADDVAMTGPHLAFSSSALHNNTSDWLLAGRHMDKGEGLLSLVAAVTAATTEQQLQTTKVTTFHNHGNAHNNNNTYSPASSTALTASNSRALVLSSTDQDSGFSSSSPLTIAPNPISLTSQEQYLMRYYIDKVVQLSCVFDNAKSPWKTIHLPRALQGIGELGVGKPTSTIRSALRNDLLSISAFQLSNHHRFEKRADDAEKWSRAASRYRGEAIALLNHAVTHDLDPRSRPKYKDFLATMLSMISINVMSGDTSTCGVHLDGAAQLISHMKSYKSEYSAKARSLHRIYCYIRLIYESTAPRPTSPGLQIHRTLHLQSMDLTPDSPFLSLRERNQPKESNLDLSSYECVYGIPQSLLAFMKRSVQLIDQVSEARRKTSTASIPDSVAQQCDQLENELLDWDVNDYLPSSDSSSESQINASTNIIRFQTLAFYNALIIYLSQHIRLLNHRFLHPYIEAVIHNIEEIEKIKTRKQMIGAPLYWPVFIAASEAYDKRLQERFRRWYDEVERYGIEAVKTGVQVIYQVWDEGPQANRTTCAWRNITQKARITLMLT